MTSSEGSCGRILQATHTPKRTPALVRRIVQVTHALSYHTSCKGIPPSGPHTRVATTPHRPAFRWSRKRRRGGCSSRRARASCARLRSSISGTPTPKRNPHPDPGPNPNPYPNPNHAGAPTRVCATTPARRSAATTTCRRPRARGPPTAACARTGAGEIDR